MSNVEERLGNLRRLAEMQRERALQALVEAGAARAATAARIEALATEVAAARAAAAGDPALGQRAETFADWARQHKAALLARLAEEMALWEGARAAAARAVGRDEVLRRLAVQQAEGARRRMARRGQG